ncbi:hypothetical protein BT96DRAFT_951040 [Gymnopus androsaceus JB14]|uniref:Uncharacterized protein n=1 Tax=Gymnopus androsaceus JB14 TaxID=1447944 RepID=A0A6A4GDZ4_9AGAR|nr:hypothetical protein BT96DRAFT_951040 [Gymnopus androsaceus JB14]
MSDSKKGHGRPSEWLPAETEFLEGFVEVYKKEKGLRETFFNEFWARWFAKFPLEGYRMSEELLRKLQLPRKNMRRQAPMKEEILDLREKEFEEKKAACENYQDCEDNREEEEEQNKVLVPSADKVSFAQQQFVSITQPIADKWALLLQGKVVITVYDVEDMPGQDKPKAYMQT